MIKTNGFCGKDFEILENGDVLYYRDWNGEVYTIKENGQEITYRPIHAGIGDPDEEGNYDQMEIIGYECSHNR